MEKHLYLLISLLLLAQSMTVFATDEETITRKLTYDDGNVVESISMEYTGDTIVGSTQQKAIDHINRLVIQPVKNAATNTAARVGKVLAYVKHTAGLDTNASFVDGTIDKFKQKVKFIYPGTRWCGDGNRARFDDDLGTFEETDRCCRWHDLCGDSIAAGAEKYGLQNNGLFTRSHCTCDNDFFACLKNTTELAAKAIGITYFTILRPQCFKEEAFVTACLKYHQ